MSAKAIHVAPISASAARALVRRYHYSGKVTQNSQLHLGVFLAGRCLGAMQFGPPIDKRKTMALVRDTPWNGFLELNRMAFSDALPRNSESRALAIALRMIRQQAPHVQWVVSFADATQSGDGAIYRATGFVLTNIKRNLQMLRLSDGTIIARKTLDNPNHMGAGGRFGSAIAREQGAVPLPGFQLRYVYFLDPTARARLTVPELPYTRIAEMGAGMYRGVARAESIVADAPVVQTGEGGSIPTSALHDADAPHHDTTP